MPKDSESKAIKPKQARSVKTEVERELHGRAGGRCEFDGCNNWLYTSPVTSERVNIAEKAHIWSFSPDGPRGQGEYAERTNDINEIDNLILVCRVCHKLIDRDKDGVRYSAELLKRYKHEHERAVFFLTDCKLKKQSHAVSFFAPVGGKQPTIEREEIFDAMLPDRYPVGERATDLSLATLDTDNESHYWSSAVRHLSKDFDQKVKPLLDDPKAPSHFSVFSIAPQPLLILLGSLFSDHVAVDAFQRQREPRTWKWQEGTVPTAFEIREPSRFDGVPALVFSVSATITHERLRSVLGEDVSIWEITVPNPSTDLIKCREQISAFRQTARETLRRIHAAHGAATELHVFPALSVALSFNLGYIRQSKADSNWIIYDQNAKRDGFIPTITMGPEVRAL